MERKDWFKARGYKFRDRSTRGQVFTNIFTPSIGRESKGGKYCEGSYQLTYSKNNPSWHAAKRRDQQKKPAVLTRRDIGGDFYTELIRYELPLGNSFTSWATRNGSQWYSFTGILFPDTISYNMARKIHDSGSKTALPSQDGISNAALAPYGATAVNRTIPTNPGVSVATTIGELREGLPSLIGSSLKKHGAKGGADEYLNIQFGVLPLVSDAIAIRDAYNSADKTLAQWYRDSGRVVRRRYSFPDEVDEDITIKEGVYPHGGGASINAYQVSKGTLTVRRETRREIWFSGAYTYHIPKYMSSIQRQAGELDRLYGIKPNISVAWNLTPWSWLVDWFSNTGDVLENIDSLGKDGLVLTHGYIMCRTTVHETRTWQGQYLEKRDWMPWVAQSTQTSTTKQRMRANPYGIGFTGNSLTGKQLSILAALGISKGKHRIPD